MTAGFTLCFDIMEMVGKEVELKRHKNQFEPVMEQLLQSIKQKDYEENWDWCYGSDLVDNKPSYPLDFVMAGGGSHAWNWVIKEDGIWKWEYGRGTSKIGGMLVCSECGNYLKHFDYEYELRDGETDMYELTQELDLEPDPDPSESDTESDDDDY